MFALLLRKWPVVLVLTVALLHRRERDEAALLWFAIAGVGVLMNVVVIWLNGGMPAKVALDEIPEADRDAYHPLDGRTRLPFLADWIPMCTLLISPGDILVTIAAVALLLKAFIA